jgi:hypothetical protein
MKPKIAAFNWSVRLLPGIRILHFAVRIFHFTSRSAAAEAECQPAGMCRSYDTEKPASTWGKPDNQCDFKRFEIQPVGGSLAYSKVC